MPASRHVLVGAVLRDPVPLRRVVGVAVLAHPAGAGQQPVVAPHVQQRHLADHGAEQLRALQHHRADQQPAVAAALDGQPPRLRDACGDQVLGHGDEVVEGLLPLALQRRLVPAGAELAAAADVGHHLHAAAAVPGRAEAARVLRLQRHLEAAVAVEQRRVVAVGRGALGPDHEVGHARAVLRRGEALLDAHAGAVEEGRAGLQQLARVAAGAAQQQRLGREEVGVAEQVVSRPAGRPAPACRAGSARAACRGRALRTSRACQRRAVEALLLQPAGDVVQQLQQHAVAQQRIAGQRACGGGREQRVHCALPSRKACASAGQQRAARPGAAALRPVAAQGQQHLAVPEAQLRVGRLVQLAQLAVDEQEFLAAEEVGRALQQGALEAGRGVHMHAGGRRRLLRLEHRHGVGQRLAALPALDEARVARIGERAGAEIGADEDRVAVQPDHVGLGLGQAEAAGHELPGRTSRTRAPPARRRRRATARPGSACSPGPGTRRRPRPSSRLRLRPSASRSSTVSQAGCALAVFGQRGAPPQAARVVGVLPEVVDEVAAPRDGRDAVARVQHLQDALARGLEAGPGFEPLRVRGIALAHPVQRLSPCTSSSHSQGSSSGSGRGGGGQRHGKRASSQPAQEAAGSSARR